MRRAAVLALGLVLAGCVAPTASDVPQRREIARDPGLALPSMKRFGAAPASAPRRSNASIAADFLELSFRMESGREIPRLTRFEGPVRVSVTGQVPATAAADLADLVRRLRSEAGIDISVVPAGGPVEITVEFMPRSRMQAAVPHAACFVVPRVSGWDEFRAARLTPKVDWTTLTVRERVSVFVPSDVAPQEIRDCLHEEIAQALGPLNDLYHLSDSVFNDDNFHNVLTGFDMLILRATYAPELRSGMTRAEVAAVLPGVLARLNPGGQGAGGAVAGPTPRAWTVAIETALGPRTAAAERRAAAQRALQIAEAHGWQDNRRAFSHFALARLSLASEVESAVRHFAEAARIWRGLPEGAVHLAHVDMQMAAFALSSGQYAEALAMTDRAIPAVQRAQNAALLSTLMLIRAEALDGLGRTADARAVRMDSLGWARYGFGADGQVHSRMREIAALGPARVASRN
ncbi:MAG: DUF2927 domain-containing protein [Gemmobacter sp.]